MKDAELPSSESQKFEVWAFGGGKGGTGKSALAASVGFQLSRLGQRVVLLCEQFVPGTQEWAMVQEAIRTVADAAQQTGKHWGMPSSSPERTKQLLDLGARFICHGADIIMVKTGLEEIQRRFGPLGFLFERRS